MLKLEDIHFHDCKILKVDFYPIKKEIHYSILYPSDWENNIFEEKTIIFFKVTAHDVNEIEIEGNPSILDANIEYLENGIRIYLETNAGTRKIDFSDLEMI